MSLHLVSMLIHTSKEVRASMHIQHYPLPRITHALPFLIIGFHLNPLSLQIAPQSAPLPPSLPANFLNTMVPQLFLYSFRCLCDVLLLDLDLVYPDPRRMRHPLGREALDIFDGVVGRVEQEFLDQVEALVVGNLRRGFLRACFAIEILFR